MINKFETSIKVDKNIVPLLSKSAYQRSFAEAVRELVSNSYDADALTVKITVEKNLENITIEDDGNGMTEKDFDKFITIAQRKGETEFSKKYRRKRIGQFGIGFLAIFPFCEELKITSTVENSVDVLTATIPTKEFFEILKDHSESKYVEQIKVNGNIIQNEKERLNHYTRFELKQPTYFLKNYFKKSKTRKRSSILNSTPLERFKWELQEDLPIDYEVLPPDTEFLKYKEPIGLSVYLNQKKIFRNPLCRNIIDKGQKSVAKFTYKFVLSTNYNSITPLEARGIKLRVNNVGIGGRTDFYLKRDRGFARLHWITGEIHISENIKEYLTLNRNEFISDSNVDEVQETFAEILRKNAYELDKISVAEKALLNLQTESKTNIVKPKTQMFSENITKLKKAGFEIITTQRENDSTLKIDKNKKQVYVGNIESFTQDTISIASRQFQVKYSKWNTKLSPCKIAGDIIEINLDYPLFKSKTYGNLFKKLHVALALVQQSNTSSEDMYKNLIDLLNNDFKEFY